MKNPPDPNRHPGAFYHACAHVSSHGHADGDHHNLANSFTLAMTRTIAFFDKYVEGE